MIARYTRRHLRRAKCGGVFVGIIGPDGAGKTTLARELSRLCAERNCDYGYIHARPRLVEHLRTCVPPERPIAKHMSPNTRTGRARAASIARLIRSAIMFNAFYYLRVLPRLRRGALVVADRWAYTYVLQPLTVRYHASPSFAVAVCTRFVRRPDVVFALTANAKLILERKSDLSLREIEGELELARAHQRALRLTWLDASLPPEQLADDILRYVDNHFAPTFTGTGVAKG